ncbi:MAG: ATP-binding protein [Phycisphaerales bacterium]|jgi:signal transduction histidine kinase
MRIKQKLIFGFVGIALLVVVVGYVAVNTSRRALQKSIGETSIALAVDTIKEIDRNFFMKIELFQEYSTNSTLREAVSASNRDFDRLEDIRAFIEEKDREWTSVPREKTSTFMLELLKSKLSRELREKMHFYEAKYDLEVFSEVFVTNKYGANIALTGKTSDYYQADELWWQFTHKDGLYISDVEYNESAGIYSTNIGIRIDDEDGDFLGIIKAVVNIEEVTGIIKEATELSKYESVDFKLFTKDGKIIYDTKKDYGFFEDISEKDFFKRITGETGYLIKQAEKKEKNEGQAKLLAYACSNGYRSYKGLGWILSIEYQTKELFTPVTKLRNFILSISLILTMMCVIMGVLVSDSISKPLSILRDAAARVGGGDMDVQIEIKSNNEIGQLATSFMKMTDDLKHTTTSINNLNKEVAERKKAEKRLQQVLQDYEWKNWELDAAIKRKKEEIAERKRAEAELQETHEKLVETAHKAGMAEVATDVLHNVGNVLNSINVSTALIIEKVSGSKLANIKKIADIINDHTEDLGTFLAEDPQGKHIPVYLSEVGKLLSDEQADILSTLKTLGENVEHVKHIISMQQSYARVAGVEVSTSLNELVEDAIQINTSGMERRGIRIIREFEDLTNVEIDKQRVLQILVNLISNAKHALSASDKEDKAVTVRLYKHGESHFRIEVADNGVGISKENLTNIFKHGFTTRKDGHGFGLHSGALAAMEMDGSLTMHSEGIGQGATFTLELPLKLVEVKQ